jgi:hypothetical protein
VPSARSSSGVLTLFAIGLAALALAGCETTAERSAALARSFHRVKLSRQGLSITHPSRVVKVLDATLVHDANGTAAVLTLRNEGTQALHQVPIAITLKGSGGQPLYENNTPGLDPSLTSTPLLLPHRTSIWVDDQLPPSAFPASITALVGEAPMTDATVPRLDIRGAHLVEDPANGAGVQGTIDNRSSTAQQNLVIYAVARRGGKVMAAGRAVLAGLSGNTASPFQIYFIGNPAGAKLELSAPPSTLG